MIPDALTAARSYASLSVRDRLELLAFEARLAGFPESLIQAAWEAVDALPWSTSAPRSARPPRIRRINPRTSSADRAGRCCTSGSSFLPAAIDTRRKPGDKSTRVTLPIAEVLSASLFDWDVYRRFKRRQAQLQSPPTPGPLPAIDCPPGNHSGSAWEAPRPLWGGPGGVDPVNKSRFLAM